jgi:uncharacterized membrane protein
MNPAQWTTSQIAKTALIGMLGAIPVLAPNLAKTFGLTDSTLIGEKADALMALGGGLWMLGSLVWALIERVRSNVQPLTLTKAAAAAAITPTSQVMQDAHDAIQAGATINSVDIVPPSPIDLEPK